MKKKKKQRHFVSCPSLDNKMKYITPMKNFPVELRVLLTRLTSNPWNSSSAAASILLVMNKMVWFGLLGFVAYQPL